jgi:hypothetical protein
MNELIVGISSSAITTVIIGVVVYFSREWIAAKLRWKLKHEYDKKLLELESQREIRLKGEVVADLLAQWIRKNGNLDYHELNRLTFQAFLWLPTDLAEELSNCLARKSGAKNIREVLIDIRKYLHGNTDTLKANNIIVFDEPEVLGGGLANNELSKAQIRGQANKKYL